MDVGGRHVPAALAPLTPKEKARMHCRGIWDRLSRSQVTVRTSLFSDHLVYNSGLVDVVHSSCQSYYKKKKKTVHPFVELYRVSPPSTSIKHSDSVPFVLLQKHQSMSSVKYEIRDVWSLRWEMFHWIQRSL